MYKSINSDYYFSLCSSSAKLAFISIKVISDFILYNKKRRGEIENYHNSEVTKHKSRQKLYRDFSATVIPIAH